MHPTAYAMEYLRELEKRKPASERPKYDPKTCAYGTPKRVPVADFETDYATKIPPEQFRDAIRCLQRGVREVPYCAIEAAPVQLRWRKVGRLMLAHYVCTGCGRRAPAPYGEWHCAE